MKGGWKRGTLFAGVNPKRRSFGAWLTAIPGKILKVLRDVSPIFPVPMKGSSVSLSSRVQRSGLDVARALRHVTVKRLERRNLVNSLHIS